MKQKGNGAIQRSQRLKHMQGEGPNWILIAGGALLSTLTIRFGCKLKQVLDTKQTKGPSSIKEIGNSAAKNMPGACQSHSNLCCYSQDRHGCYQCLSGMSDGGLVIKQGSINPVSKEVDLSLPLVKVSAADSNNDSNGVMWASSPDCLELPHKQFHSNSSDSPCVSESGSDIYSKREVIQKLRQQLKRRDEMIMEMQTQIIDLKNSLSIQMTHSADLQSQLDSANNELLNSQIEIQRLRKAIADHCIAEVVSPGTSRNRKLVTRSYEGQVNGYLDCMDDAELHSFGVENVRGYADGVEMLKKEVGDLKELIEGKDFLLQSYKKQKAELCLQIEELQLKLAPQCHSPEIL